MKKLFIAVFALGLLGATANAQDQKYKVKGDKKEMKGGGFEHGLKALNLTTDQKNRIAAVNETYKNQMESLRNENLGQQDRRSRMETLHRQHVESIRAVLTQEQRTKWDAMRPAGGQADKFKFKEKGNRSGMMDNGNDRDFGKLNLTADQRNRIAEINQNFRQQMTNLRNENLSQGEMKTRRETLQRQHVENIQAVLTSEQRTQLNTLHEGNNRKVKEGKSKYKNKTKSKKS